MKIEEFEKLPLMGILRGIKEEALESLVEAVSSSGLKTIEIAMNTPGAGKLIKLMKEKSKGRLDIGAGTVLDKGTLLEAIDSGASFIVSPVLIPDVVGYCKEKNIPVFPGAFTPQEIYNAWSAGASMVKVFPAKFAGSAYFKEIKAPLNNIKLLACGGVNKETLPGFFKSGASAVAFGGSIFKKEYFEKNDFASLKKDLQELTQVYKNL